MRFLVILLQDENEVRDCQHANKPLPFRVPQRSGTHTVVHQRKEGLFHGQLRIEDHELRTFRHDIIARMTLHEMRIDFVVTDCEDERRDETIVSFERLVPLLTECFVGVMRRRHRLEHRREVNIRAIALSLAYR